MNKLLLYRLHWRALTFGLLICLSTIHQTIRASHPSADRAGVSCYLNGVHITESMESVLVTGAAGMLGMYLTRHLVDCGVNNTVAIDEFNAESSIHTKRLRANTMAEDEMKPIHVKHAYFCGVNSRPRPHSGEIIYGKHSHYFILDEGISSSCLSAILQMVHSKNTLPSVTVLLDEGRNVRSSTESGGKSPMEEALSIVLAQYRRAHFRLVALLTSTSPHVINPTWYGPWCDPDNEVSSYVSHLASKRTIHMHANGEEERRYVHAIDAAQYIISAVLNTSIPQQPVLIDYMSNVGTIVSQKGLVRELEQVQKTHARIYLVNESSSIQFERTANHAPILRDFQMVQGALRQSTPLLNGLKAHVDWVQSYYRQLYPCASECASAGLCFKSAWDETMRLSTLATNGCDAVVYLVATGRLVDEIHKIDDYKVMDRSRLCNIAFVSGDSMLYKSLKYVKSGFYHWKTRNGWLLLPVGELDSFADPRKASRVPKLSPGRFFASSVRYAIYMDVKLVWKCDPGLLLQLMSGENVPPDLEQRQLQDLVYDSHLSNNISAHKWGLLRWEHVEGNVKPLGFLAISFAPRRGSVFEDFDIISKLSSSRRKNITYYPELLEQQRMAYDEEKKKYGINFKDLFEGALLVHDLHSSSSKRFRCMWYEEYQKWCDRDQLSGAYAWAWQHWLSSPHGDGKGSSLISLGTDEGGRVIYGRLLDRVYHWRADVNYTEGDWHKTALIVDLDHLSFDGH